ncbi:MAG: hypothetical protein WA126_10850 [Thermodesulfovibrionales bacterium]
MCKKLSLVPLVIFFILILFNLAWSSVEGLWDVTGTTNINISMKGLKLEKLKLPFDDQFIFDNNGTFEMSDLEGTWIQKKTQFEVYLNHQNIASFFKDFIQDHYGLNVDVYVTKSSFKGKENSKKNIIEGNITLQMDITLLNDGKKGKLKAIYKFKTPLSGGVTSNKIKDEIKLGVLSLNTVAFSVMNNMDDIIEQILENFSCNNFSSSVSTTLIINNSPHNAYASGQVKFYNNGGNFLNCNDILNADSLLIKNAEISGSGNISGNEVNSKFQGNFKITGSDGYLISADMSNGIYISDYFIINGSGLINDIKLQGTKYPDISGNVNNVKVDVEQGIDLLFNVLSGHSINLGDVARIIKDGNIVARSLDCSNITIHFNGTNLVDVSSPCTSPSNFKVDVITGEII